MPWARWGGGQERGWAADLGGGKMFREPFNFSVQTDIVKVQEMARAVVARLQKTSPQLLRRIPEGASVKPAGCPELVPRWEPRRRGTYQVVMALSSTVWVVYPRSHLYKFPKPGKIVCSASDYDLQWLQRHNIRRRECLLAPGDILVMKGGLLLHGSPMIPLTGTTQFCTFAHFR